MSGRAGWVLLALTGCVSVATTPDSGVSPPLNVCPAHPCTAYDSQTPAPICNGGACLVSSLYSNLELVVSLAEDSDFAPGQSVAIPYGSLTPGSVTCSGPTPCAQLPAYAVVQGAYTVQPSVQLPYSMGGVGWNLGNPGQPTALPIHVTYRPLVQPAGAGTTTFDATAIGLPLDLIPAFVVVETAPSSPLGPAKGPSIGFQANLQANQLYEATFQPDPPFDAAFPPEVENVTFMTGTQNDEDSLVPDITTSLGSPLVSGPQFPNFSVYRLPDGLAGWQAYLREHATRRRVSSVATLGTRTNDCASTKCTVVLATNHHPPDGDALTGTEIVIAPPLGVPLPTYVSGFIGGEFPYSQHYPVLPAPITVTGTVTDVSGKIPVEAELYFEVTEGNSGEGIYTNDGSQGLALNPLNFEYTAETMAAVDARTGAATYSISLAPGVYAVTVRPLDSLHEVTAVPAFDVDPTAGAMSPNMKVDFLRPVQGFAQVADARPMTGATVEAIPAPCSASSSGGCAPIDPLTMPRGGQTTTDALGNFDLALDPGNYLLRIQPQDGTLFPWVTQPLLVGPTPVTVPPITVPAPVHAGGQLFDPYGNAVVNAVVRVYQVPTSGPAIEAGRALTDSTGTYDLYLAPSSP